MKKMTSKWRQPKKWGILKNEDNTKMSMALTALPEPENTVDDSAVLAGNRTWRGIGHAHIYVRKDNFLGKDN